MKNAIAPIIVLIALTCGVSLVIARSNQPNPQLTGAPAIGTYSAENNCTQCHSGNALNSGGTVEVLGIPGSYDVNTTYNLTVRITSSQTSVNSNRRWGFELTAVRLDNGDGVGTLASAALDSVFIDTANNRQYALQSGPGEKTSFPSPVEYKVDWTSPGTIVGPVAFFANGLAGNGSGTGGDWVYTFGDTVLDVTPVRTTTWGQVKQRFRQ